MKQEPVLIIMAAGMGSRFGGLKQIEPISGQGEIILDFSLYDALMAGFKKAIFVIKRENEEDFRRIIENKAGKHMEVMYAFQDIDDLPSGFKPPDGRMKPWGTAHAVFAARKLVQGPFAVINADDYYGPGAFQTIYEFLQTAQDDKTYKYCMVGYPVENTLTENGYVSRGVCMTSKENYLTEITERTNIGWMKDKIVYTDEEGINTELQRGTVVSMNFWGFTKSMMDEIEKGFPEFLNKALMENPLKGEYYLPGVVDRLIREEKARVKVLKSTDRWFGVTYKEDKESVVNALQSMKDKGVYPEKLWK